MQRTRCLTHVKDTSLDLGSNWLPRRRPGASAVEHVGRSRGPDQSDWRHKLIRLGHDGYVVHPEEANDHETQIASGTLKRFCNVLPESNSHFHSSSI